MTSIWKLGYGLVTSADIIDYFFKKKNTLKEDNFIFYYLQLCQQFQFVRIDIFKSR